MNVPKCLSNISPRWAKVLDEYSINDIMSNVFTKDDIIDNDDDNALYELEVSAGEKALSIQSFNCCIVGEAYNFSRTEASDYEYGCHTCYRFSMDFCNKLEVTRDEYEETSDEAEYNVALLDYENLIEKFCEHIGSEHPELIKNEVECDG